MALHMTLMVNENQIGYLIVRRISPDHPRDDDLCHYTWRININGKTSFAEEPLIHRFGDGAWALVSRVIECAGYGAGLLNGTE